ncbi:MAG TPA: MFS transporter [Streptosporangiaceae bacterium]|nr:MFS transporter [Streptosporangiaceae bacterium]
MSHVPSHVHRVPFSHPYRLPRRHDHHSALFVSTVAALGACCSALGDRISRRTLIFGSALVFVLGSIIATAATNTDILVTGRAILGIAIGLYARAAARAISS